MASSHAACTPTQSRPLTRATSPRLCSPARRHPNTNVSRALFSRSRPVSPVLSHAHRKPVLLLHAVMPDMAGLPRPHVITRSLARAPPSHNTHPSPCPLVRLRNTFNEPPHPPASWPLPRVCALVIHHVTQPTRRAEILAKIKQYIQSHPEVLDDPTRWITGMGCDQTKWPSGMFPTADDFDREPLLRGRPILLARIDVHAYWVSNRVLELIPALPDEVDGDANKPTGIFVDNAMALIPLPERTHDQMLESFEITMRDTLSAGLTSIHDAASSTADIAF
ncbi:hypothetical protein FA95DRAFT_1612182 [Auriscalpium vulgare]|uniref:Uncharacterized protein n=1 Tax=Auriscalpium vulgare TaxID=40419 RepID=A0ACB8R820_9AGAM|nr:hypothetical protein FA95DRAFT_1612182 [Auriscalpium vulgare]